MSHGPLVWSAFTSDFDMHQRLSFYYSQNLIEGNTVNLRFLLEISRGGGLALAC